MHNYYPFGLEHKGYNDVTLQEFNYKQFQGQEYTEDLGLNVHEFKYRVHDPSIGRFWQVDPLAEEYNYNGTYNFAENKVIQYNELEGLEAAMPSFYTEVAIRTGQFINGLNQWFSGAASVVTESITPNKSELPQMTDSSDQVAIMDQPQIQTPISEEAATQMIEGVAQMSDALPDSQDVKEVGDGIALTGSALVMAAPYAGPFAPEVAGVGGAMATTGTAISAGVDFYNGDEPSFVITVGSSVVGGAAGKKVLSEMGDTVAKEVTSTVISNTATMTEKVINN